MKNKIYGNETLISALENMAVTQKTAQTVLFYGEKGCGRKTLADYYCRLLLCTNLTGGKPCGSCKACHNIESGVHPDVIFAEKSGKLGGYSVDTAKRICSDSYIKPNNGDRKIYIFSDCHAMDARTQNTLLKIIEEPPEHAYFIFTSESKSDFLPTIISRCSCFQVSECSEEECRTALLERGYDQNQIDYAVGCFHGNIGMCIDLLSEQSLKKTVELTKTLVNSIISSDEYGFAAAVSGLGRDRNEIKQTLAMLDKQVRDAAVIASGVSTDKIGCYPEGAYRLSEKITASQAVKIHESINRAWYGIETNANAVLILTALCTEIASVCC